MSSTSSSHRFLETYNAGIAYALLNRRFLPWPGQGRFRIRPAAYSRKRARTVPPVTGSTTTLTALFRAPLVSVGFFPQVRTTNIQRPFRGKLRSHHRQLRRWLVAGATATSPCVSIIPIRLRDRRSKHRHPPRNRHLLDQCRSFSRYTGSTNLNYTQTENTSEATSDDIDDYKITSKVITFRNQLPLSSNKQLHSTVRYRDDEADSGQTEEVSVGETLDWQLGKALESRAALRRRLHRPDR